MKPDISVIMSVYNGEAYLAEAIESVIAQTFANWELIVINDCSKDGTAELLEAFSAKDERIRVSTNEVNLKLPASLNKAVSLARGKYIARMDADDICLPERLEKQFAFMEENEDIALSSCRFMTLKNGVYQSGGAGGRCGSRAVRAMLLVSNPILHPGVIGRAEIFKEYPYDTKLTCSEDLELWTRLVMERKKLAILPECLMIYRLHDKQITSTSFERQCTEVAGIKQNYFASFGDVPTDEMLRFFIRGVYFRKEADPAAFLRFIRWVRKLTAGKMCRKCVNYALLEILAEYKRCGVPKKEIAKLLLAFDPFFVLQETVRRKKAAREDIAKFTAAAERLGLHQTGGTPSYPVYEK